MSTPPPKKQVALALLERSGIFVHLDPRGKDVVVPSQFKQQTELVLQFGLNMRIPIKDLEVDDEGISGTLSFSRRPFWCRIPWDAVVAIVSDADRRGFAWQRAEPPAPKRPHLRAVGPDEGAAPEAAEAEPSVPAGLAGEGTCKLCSIKWLEDAELCPLCGSTRAEAFLASAPEPGAHAEGASASDATGAPERVLAAVPSEVAPGSATSESASERRPKDEERPDANGEDEPPPDAPPPKRPHLRLVK